MGGKMRIVVLDESKSGEPRVAVTPETIKKLIGLGASITVQAGAGRLSSFPDSEFQQAGATVASAKDLKGALAEADVLLGVSRPDPAQIKGIRKGALALAAMDPYNNADKIQPLADAGLATFAMELMPRITRAQVMDILSSQANLAGYRAVIDAAGAYGRAFPMMMTAAGTVPAAKAFIMGVGVAGLQAIATARRLGAVVTATDVRPATKEQVESLGAKFLAVEDEEFKQAQTAGGYAKEMSKEYQAKQAELTASHIAKQDIVITTALIPGRPAPKLIDDAMIASMKPGSVIVDLAVERGGNTTQSKLGEVVTTANGVQILGYGNLAMRLPQTASGLFAKNLFAFLETMIDKTEKKLAVNWDDELVKATLLSRDGALVHPMFQPKA
jgi:NAD(P) transhydrogenase subunit alpha